MLLNSIAIEIVFRNYRKNGSVFDQWNFTNLHITFYESVVIKTKQIKFVLDFSFE